MKRVNLQRIIERGVSRGVKSIFLFPGFAPMGSKKGIIPIGGGVLSTVEIENIIQETTTKWQLQTFQEEKEIDYSYSIEGFGRFRVSAFLRSTGTGIVMRPIPEEIPSLDSLGLPPILKSFVAGDTGLVLITGPTGSGKSTTLASIVDYINRTRPLHIVAIEEVVELVYKPYKSIVSQREIGRDTKSYGEALRRVLREDPDVVVIGDIREGSVMKSTLEIAATGHLVLANLHTTNAAQTIQRIIDFFPENEKRQIRKQVAEVLIGIVSQRLLNSVEEKGFFCACEVLVNTKSMENLIREGKIHQVTSQMAMSKKDGMATMDDALIALLEKGKISVPDTIEYSSKDKAFIEKVVEKSSTEGELLEGKGVFAIERQSIAYEAIFRRRALTYFDSSGTLLNTPLGLIFRDRSHSRGGFHFIVDYTILNGKKDPFPLNTLFNLTYKINGVKVGKDSYDFILRLIAKDKDKIELPKKPAKLLNDNEWHTLAVPVPKIHVGAQVRYYMMLFEDDIKEIIFTNILFM